MDGVCSFIDDFRAYGIEHSSSNLNLALVPLHVDHHNTVLAKLLANLPDANRSDPRGPKWTFPDRPTLTISIRTEDEHKVEHVPCSTRNTCYVGAGSTRSRSVQENVGRGQGQTSSRRHIRGTFSNQKKTSRPHSGAAWHRSDGAYVLGFRPHN